MSENNNTEQAILEAAEEIFLEKGYNGASTTKIAEKAGVTHAMLHYYFRTKEKIFIKILDSEVNAMLSSMKSVMSPKAGLWETLEKAIGLYYDFLDSHRRLPFLILNVADNCPEMLDKYRKSIMLAVERELSLHSERIAAEMSSGEINRIDPLQFIFTVISLSLSTFVSLPLMQKVVKMNDAQVTEFIGKRREETIRMVYMQLYAKVPETQESK